MMSELGIAIDAISADADAQRKDGHTVMYVAIDGRPAGLIGVADPIKASTAEALKMLQDDGVKIVVLTGDNRITAAAVAKKLGIDRVEAEVLPDQKASVVKRLQSEGRIVAMAGDGINDAPALAQASRHRDGHRHRRCDGERGRHPGQGRSAWHREGSTPQPGNDEQHPAEPLLRVLLQRAWDTDRGWRSIPDGRPVAQSNCRERRDESELRVRYRQRAQAQESETLKKVTRE
jgi:hypothetical protein